MLLYKSSMSELLDTEIEQIDKDTAISRFLLSNGVIVDLYLSDHPTPDEIVEARKKERDLFHGDHQDIANADYKRGLLDLSQQRKTEFARFYTQITRIKSLVES
jgi:hypothetical protein